MREHVRALRAVRQRTDRRAPNDDYILDTLFRDTPLKLVSAEKLPYAELTKAA